MPNIVASASQPPPAAPFIAQVESRLGRRSTAWTRPDTGLSAALRFLVTLDDGQRVFVKAATDDATQAWLENERTALQCAPPRLAPEILDWFQADAGFHVLITQALEGHWPASHRGVDWRDGLNATIAAIKLLSRIEGPSALPATPKGELRTGWEPRLVSAATSAGVASAAWFAEHQPALVAAEAALDRSGSAFVHGDMRSDNVCLLPDGPRFVDWSSSARGAPETDLAAFLPAARLEGGPPPEDILSNGGSWASAQAAQAAATAASAENVPAWLRGVCWRLTAINLDWAVASLGLSARDGESWNDL